MLIETYDDVYTVLQHCYTNTQFDTYMCRRRSDNELYTVIRVLNKEMTEKILDFICSQARNRSFSDLAGHFVADGDFYVVFAYAQGMTLHNKLAQRCALEERMVLGRRILERIVLQGQPYYFVCQCLEPQNILVTDALDISFNYTLDKVEQYGFFTGAEAVSHIYSLMLLLFAQEIKKNNTPPLQPYLEYLETLESFDSIEQYRRYNELCAQIRAIPKEELAVSKGLWYRIKQFIKKLHLGLKKVLLPVVFIGVFIYMMYNVYMAFQDKGRARHFDAIGTVNIEEAQAFDAAEPVYDGKEQD